MTAESKRKPVRVHLVMVIILLWAVLLVAFMSLMMAGHMIPLPEPDQTSFAAIPGNPVLLNLKSPATHSPGGGKWKLVHILVAGCPCSTYTAQMLVARRPATNCLETVLVLGGDPDWEPSLLQAGFEVQNKDGQALMKETGIAGGPWLLIISPGGKIAYSGGYATERPRPGVALQDMNLFQAALNHGSMPHYQAYGCAATPLAQGKFDPIAVCQSIQ